MQRIIIFRYYFFLSLCDFILLFFFLPYFCAIKSWVNKKKSIFAHFVVSNLNIISLEPLASVACSSVHRMAMYDCIIYYGLWMYNVHLYISHQHVRTCVVRCVLCTENYAYCIVCACSAGADWQTRSLC